MTSTAKPFVKIAPESALDMFEAEADGLRELAAADVIRVPRVYEVGVRAGQAFIEMERLQFVSASSRDERMLGEQLAALHRVTRDMHGWFRDNTIGPTPQRNEQSDNWAGFYSVQRLEFQLELARRNGYDGELQLNGRALIELLPALLEGHDPAPSLLHGDLWGGNWANTDKGPAIFDPAVYYGDRETDLAMTKLFGGFGGAFYEAYEQAWPLPAGRETRQALYQLYHVLNHLNLFGRGYLGRSLGLMNELLRTGRR